jgi:hydrogenase maturation protease
MKILIIGYGNDSRNDDGVGWRVIDQLAQKDMRGVELLTLHQLEVDLAETIREYDVVIFVDAAVPESLHAVTRTTVEGQWQPHAVAHVLTPPDLLGLCQTLYAVRPKGFLFSIRGHDFNFGMTLSPATEAAAREVVWEIRQLVDMLHGSGANAPKEPATHA